jgi:polyisoprenoid-binding protein YceI
LAFRFDRAHGLDPLKGDAMKRTILALTLAVAGVTVGGARLSAQTAIPDSPLRAGAYAVDPSRTHIDFALMRLGFAYYSGAFANPAGTLRLDPSNPAGTALGVTIPMAALSTGNTIVDADLKGPGWFDAATYPTATFTSTSVIATSTDSAEITGTLTMHGATQAATLTAHYLSAGINPATKAYEVGFEAGTTIKRSDYGLTAFLPIIGDDVRLTITGVFVARR